MSDAARRLRALVSSALPYHVRVRLRALLERSPAEPDDVARVREVTTAQWRRADTGRYVGSYWDGADDGERDSVARRRSEWLAGLPPFRTSSSVLELGCGPGRNLWVLQQRYPDTALYGVDINEAGIAHARARVRGEFVVADLYDLRGALGGRRVDLIFTMGVLIHLHPSTLRGLVGQMREHARKWLVFVEQVSETNEVVKGPARWRPTRRVAGAYIQWSPNLAQVLAALGLPFDRAEVPPALQSNGGRDLFIVPLAR